VLAAALLLFTILFYAQVYTVWLKRATPQNIVIGGAAGALPPVIGWAAATGHTSLNAWLLFAIIALWTPPHFWALALNSGGDYQKAGVPMMPVVKGAKSTRLQILLYSVALSITAVLPVFTGIGHGLYAATSILGGALFTLLAVRLWRSEAGEAALPGPDGLYSVKPGAKQARDLFAYSILYLFALFAALLIEHGLKGL
jgi:protoheme IX farnesyltransferase